MAEVDEAVAGRWLTACISCSMLRTTGVAGLWSGVGLVGKLLQLTPEVPKVDARSTSCKP